MQATPSVILKPGKEGVLQRHHPWIFAGAIKRSETGIQNGQTVAVFSSKGQWLASGAFSPHSQIRVRVWSFDPAEDISERFFLERLERAIKARAPLIAKGPLTACRMVNAESDGLPGLIVDLYGEYLVCQFLSSGVETWREVIVGHLYSLLPVKGIYERSDADVRRMEGLEPRTGGLAGQDPPERIEIREGELRFLVDVRRGHKTGFYLDQRDNRSAVPEFSKEAEVLNAFAYTGGFGLWALKGGASFVTHLDTSAESLEIAREHVELNGFDAGRVTYEQDDVFVRLRKYRDAGRQFHLIILDPPKFVTSAGQLASGSRGYKDINLLAFKLLRPGGVLFSFSCSGHVSPDLFQKILADAALDAGRDVRILRTLGHPSDHPIALNFPEGRYLKGFICRASD